MSADDEPDEGSLGDLAAALEEDFSTGLVGSGKGKPGGAPVYVYVDDTPLPSEGARTFEHVSGSTRAASAQWHCQHVRIAQVILLTTSSVQCLLGLVLSAAFIGILPLVSSILGIISATQYFVAEASSLEQVLNSVRVRAPCSAHVQCQRLYDLCDAWCNEKHSTIVRHVAAFPDAKCCPHNAANGFMYPPVQFM